MELTIKPYCRRVNYYETDKMAIVHHSNYIRFMEEARLDYMEQAGIRYEDLENSGIIMPVVSVECRYRLSLVFGDEMKIVPQLVSFNGVRAVYSYRIYRAADNALAATGRSEHCFLDEKTRKLVNLKKVFFRDDEPWQKLLEQAKNQDGV